MLNTILLMLKIKKLRLREFKIPNAEMAELQNLLT